jgi:hypothetical protein
MKVLCCIVAAAGILVAIPAFAEELYGRGAGISNIWSSAQGSSDSYGDGKGMSTSSSGSLSNVGGHGINNTLLHASGMTGKMGATGADTVSNSLATTNGSGYVQTQTSGYAGGRISGLAGRVH